MPNEEDRRDPRVYLAAERTFLAWIRTGLALMGFGFVVARFGLFLSELTASGTGAPVQTSAFSLPVGTALILIGVLVNILASISHVRLVRDLNRGVPIAGRTSGLAIGVAVLLAVAGLAMAVYLGSGRTIGKEIGAMRTGEGVVSKASKYPVEETLGKLQTILEAKGIAIFARVDHSGEAEKVGMKMPPAKLLIFGNPKAGTPVMLAAPLSAIDLPLKALVWQDGAGKVWVSYNDQEYLKRRFGLSDEVTKPLAGVGVLIDQALG